MHRFSADYLVHQATQPARRMPVDNASDQLLPWADPYIAMLAQAHARDVREESLNEARALAARLVLPRRPGAVSGVEASAA